MDNFFETLKNLSIVLNDKIVAYSHNLKFDGAFILSWLFENGFKWVNETDEKKIKRKTFIMIIDIKLNFYMIKVNYKGQLLEFRDSLKKIPQALEDIAIAWELPFRKGEIDYTKHHEKGAKVLLEEVEYIRRDTEIIAIALKDFYKANMDKLTISSDTFHLYRSSIGGKANFEKIFPVLDLKTDDWIRKAFHGGLCLVNPEWHNYELSNVYAYDVNSMYPFQMYMRLLPYGTPIYKEGRYKPNDLYPLAIQHIWVQLRLKDGYQPTIYKKELFRFENEYIIDTDNELIELYLTMEEIDLLYEHYHVFEIQYEDYYMFKGSTKLFERYIGDCYHEKQTHTGAKRQIAKLKMNSLFGKFARRTKRKTIEPYINNKGIVDFKVVDTYDGKPIYTAMSVFISAYATIDILKQIQKQDAKFVYCDTDSVYTIGEGIDFYLSDEIGAWKLENKFKKFKVLGQKVYMGITEEDEEVKRIAGATKHVQKEIHYNEFEMGKRIMGELSPKMVKGGMILENTSFTFKYKQF